MIYWMKKCPVCMVTLYYSVLSAGDLSNAAMDALFVALVENVTWAEFPDMSGFPTEMTYQYRRNYKVRTYGIGPMFLYFDSPYRPSIRWEWLFCFHNSAKDLIHCIVSCSWIFLWLIISNDKSKAIETWTIQQYIRNILFHRYAY